MSKRSQLLLALLGWLLIALPASADSIDFQRDIQPILTASCLKCHGPEKRKGGLLLTTRPDALLPADSGKRAVVPGDTAHSELIRRITTTEPTERMPPTGDPLSAEQVQRLRTWIEQGAAWSGDGETRARHWAYTPPVRPALPSVQARDWPQNAIDHFVLVRLEKEGLKPAEPADRARLLRRLSLDLIGLPPTLEQLDAFLKDTRSDAYERMVDQLLASPHYGERWARHWLDLARYADSNGFQRDGFRDVWPYRDWVVRAFNRDLPFNQFTIEQVAGDLLPGAVTESKIATGFHRCTTVNVEAGVDPEENRVNALFDRVNTTATVWLGTTLACAQCHNHKYDPFTQKDYYQLFAYFNNTPIETIEGAGAARQFSGPRMEMPQDAETAARLQAIQQQRNQVERELRSLLTELAPQQAAWERQQLDNKDLLKTLPANIRKFLQVDEAKRNAKQKQDLADYFATTQPNAQKLKQLVDQFDFQLTALKPATTLVMVEMDQPRPTHIFKRGNFLDKGPQVQPGVPAVLPPLPTDAPTNRLGLARWLVDPGNPLVSRVTVNRWWAEFFGQGLVATLEDFGSQSDPPIHPELLDWLATELVRGGWSMKAIHRVIVTSATYQQSSRVSPQARNRDPENQLLSRGPRFRLDAEAIRDNALAISGLLSAKMAGAPVMPPQPPGIWNVTGVVDNTYRISQGEDAYRRGLYTIWRRSSPYASFVAFDAPDRAACVVKRPRTNTPLQALTLMNDPVYVEAALALAERILTAPNLSERDRAILGFRLCLARQPTTEETRLLEQVYERERSRLAANPAKVKAILQGRKLSKGMDALQLAAWYQVAAVLLNLDETITRG